MVSLNEETHRSMPFEPAVRTALEKFALPRTDWAHDRYADPEGFRARCLTTSSA